LTADVKIHQIVLKIKAALVDFTGKHLFGEIP